MVTRAFQFVQDIFKESLKQIQQYQIKQRPWYVPFSPWDGVDKRTLVANQNLPATDPGQTAGAGSPPSFPPPLFFLSHTEEPAKANTCTHDRHALQQLALNVHAKLFDLTWPTNQKR